MPRGIPKGRAKLHHHVAKDRTPDEVLADELGKFYADPLGYVMFTWPWESEPMIQVVRLAQGVEEHLTDDDRRRQVAYRARFPSCKYGPDLWACDFLDELGREIKKRDFDGHTPVAPVYFATVSGHEIGKSVLVAWLTHFILDTRPFSKITLTAVTDEQLRTKTWAEVNKWNKLAMSGHWYECSTSRGNMSLVNKQYSDWRADARTCREEKSESFAGQHSPTATSAYIFDEASGIGSKVFEVREGGLTSGEPMVFDFGNGTRNSGAFYNECQGKLRNRYITRSIDSRTVAITNKDKIAKDAEDYGEDSDFFRVRWMGMFPERGFTQFIATADVDAAQAREPIEDHLSPLVLGVDVARFGDDDSVIWPRRGRNARFPVQVMKGFDTVEVLETIIAVYQHYAGLGVAPAMIFVDEGNTGGAVIDLLRRAGYPVTAVSFGSNPLDKITYRFKNGEIWGRMRQSIREGLVLPERTSKYGDRIHDELTQREYGFMKNTDRIMLEPKEDAKARGLSSEDMGDALACTYAMEMASLPSHLSGMELGGKVESEFDPFDDLNEKPQQRNVPSVRARYHYGS